MWRGDPFAGLDMGSNYVSIEAYARAKLMNLLWTLALARREPGIIVLSANPGMAWTPNIASFTPEAVPAWRFIWPLVRWMQKRASPADAALPALFLATAPGLESNSSAYLESDLKRKSLTPDLLDLGRQDLAWDLTANLGQPH
jgi:NAD(P)-dependent dehydrogenase (short-subunit alcohol dehydrogenase family)